MIKAAVILSAVARHRPDSAIIRVLLLANAVVGFWEEREARNAVAALKATLAIRADRHRFHDRHYQQGDVTRWLPKRRGNPQKA
jgi:magnesium-transporting ATPase (P-type)